MACFLSPTLGKSFRSFSTETILEINFPTMRIVSWPRLIDLTGLEATRIAGVLSDSDIKVALKERWISIEPYSEKFLQPASIDLRLDQHFLDTATRSSFETHPQIIDPSVDQSDYCERTSVGRDGYYDLWPNRVILASTFEYMRVSRFVAAKVEGKSSLARLGLLVHSTAGFVDPGFEGNITLELCNLNDRPIRLYAGMKIAQVCFFKLHSSPQESYGTSSYQSRYQGQRGPTASRAHEGFLCGLPKRWE